MHVGYKQCILDSSIVSQDSIALSLLQLQYHYGIIPNIKSKGVVAQKVLKKMLSLRKEDQHK